MIEENNLEANENEAVNPETPQEDGQQEEVVTSSGNAFGFERENEDLIWLTQKVNDIRMQFAKYVIGQQEMVELLMAGIFSAGHILLEGVPGVAKTLSSKVLAKALDVDFSRIQFTPDLMPSDVIGTSIFNMNESKFNFKKGPIFSNIVLIDEINRAPAKTQAALFEVMEERQITYDGVEYAMQFPFLVVATQNPVEQEGTYNLPEAQLDRFLFKIKLDYPSQVDETMILQRYKSNIKAPSLDEVMAVINADDVRRVQALVKNIIVEDKLLDYIAAITVKTRNHGKVYLGASPRASLAILKSAKAMAAIKGRDFVTPDDIQFVAPHVLNHRLILTPEAEIEGYATEDVIAEIVKNIEVPR
ncbi:MoxR-like ATPase [Lishizhenia tianjinensis]|uniref:MoxR-like ATPase n=1 Tax=Lishizhenia tianjinensis TaxID=477690 RepID=A0A1I6ZR07_9FLAO|nr:MoxR family ATPase [Lishizhenia tianjinensis]SFT65082.1 MoxR-like ATPase [Lishizhenia tianjinensis]